MHFKQSMSVHYQAISHTDNLNLNLQFFFRSNNLHKIRSSQSAANNVTRTQSNRYRGVERTFRFIDGLSLIIRRFFFSPKKYFLFSWHRTLKSSKVDEYFQLINDGRQNYPFWILSFNWLKLKYQYVHHFLQQDV